MRKVRFRSILVLVAALSLVAAACGSDEEPTDTAGGDTGATGDARNGLQLGRHECGRPAGADLLRTA